MSYIFCIKNIQNAIGQGDLAEAAKFIDANIEKYGNTPEFLKAEAFFCMQIEEYDAAILFFKQTAEMTPEDDEIYFYLATVL